MKHEPNPDPDDRLFWLLVGLIISVSIVVAAAANMLWQELQK